MHAQTELYDANIQVSLNCLSWLYKPTQYLLCIKKKYFSTWGPVDGVVTVCFIGGSVLNSRELTELIFRISPHHCQSVVN